MILNGKPINPGELRTPVFLKKREISTLPGGFPQPVYSAIFFAYARWENAHGQESIMAGSLGTEPPATVLIRYHPALDTTWVIDLDDVIYEITSIDDIGNRHEYMEIKTKTLKEG